MESGRVAVRWSPADIPGPGGVLRAGVHVPEAGPPAGRIVWVHGGSWRSGRLEDWHEPCARLARAAGWSVVAVAYRLAPGHPHPAPVEDVLAALDWTERLSPPAARLPLAVGGDSAGATIAACAALARRDLGRPLDAQVLAYPPLDPECAAPSYGCGDFPDPYTLRAAWRDHRGAAGVAVRDGVTLHSTPFEAGALEGLPPTLLVTGDLDPVADDVRTYANLLSAAGNEVRLSELPGVRHGAFLSTDALSDLLGAALSETTRAGSPQ